MASELKFSTVDVFTDTPYQGNPLAIVHVPKAVSITQLQKLNIAKEFNLSETVFLHEDVAEFKGRRFDIFTILGEIPFAGHPTIGTLCFMGLETQLDSVYEIDLQCKAGLIEGNFNPSTMTAEAQVPQSFHQHRTILKHETLLATQPNLAKRETSTVQRQGHPVVSIVNGMNFVLIELSSIDDELAAVGPAAAELSGKEELIDEGWEQSFIGVYFFAVAGRSVPNVVQLRTRMIEYSIGGDPATGSAASSLACFLARRDGTAGQAYDYEITQGVEMGRRSMIHVRVKLDSMGRIDQVLLSGTAVKIMEGKLLVD